MSEAWKDVRGYEGIYQVSNLGRIRSWWCVNGHRRILSRSHIVPGHNDWKGYVKVWLSDGVSRCNVCIHRLVAQAFIPNPLLKPQINHLDGVKAHNAASNLEWATNQENVLHAYSTGLARGRKGGANGRAKLTDDDIREIRSLLAQGVSQHRLAAQFGVSRPSIGSIRSGETWSHVL